MKKLRETFVAGLAVVCLSIPGEAAAQQWRYSFDGPHNEKIEFAIEKLANGYNVIGLYVDRHRETAIVRGNYSATTGRLRARAEYLFDKGSVRVVPIDGERVVKGRLRITSPWTAEAEGELVPSAADKRRGTFIRIDSLTKVTNTHPDELAIDPAGEIAHFVNRHSATKWRTEYTWEVPPILVAGDSASVRIGAFVSDVRPHQPISDSINVLAPDFAKQVIANYPDHSSNSETYEVPISAGYAGMNELKITVGFMSSSVVYTYRRQ